MRDEVGYFKRIVEAVADNSTCGAAKVGAVFVHPEYHIILSTGYNGAPRGTAHCGDVCDNRKPGGKGKEHCNAVHAEINAIANAARVGTKLDGSILYLSMNPCLACARVLINSGVSQIVAYGYYPDEVSLGLLKEAGVPISFRRLEED